MPSVALPTPSRVPTIRADALSRAIGLVGGFLLPFVAAMLYRTYNVTVSPPGLEITRQLGLVYLAGELGVILYAGRRGHDALGTFRRLPTWAKVALVLFLATFWISSVAVSRMVPFSMGLSIGWIIHLLFAASLHHLARTATTVDAQPVAAGFVAGLVMLTAFIAVQFARVPDALFGNSFGFDQSTGVDLGSAIPGFISSRLFGAWCGAVLALATGLAWQAHGPDKLHRPYLMMAVAFGLVVWTATRAALLGWAIVLPVAWLLAGSPAARAFRTRLPLYLLVAGVVGLLLPPYGAPQFSFFRVGGLASADALSSGRLVLWETALRIAADTPLLGSGAGSNWWLVPLNGFYHVQPHNAVVQFLLNWGLIPTILALALLVGATWRAHAIARVRGDLLPFVLMLDCLLVMSLLDGMLHFAQFIMLIFGCLAICLAQADGGRASAA